MMASLGVLAVSSIGCNSSRQETEAKDQVSTREILELEQGASVDSVKERLGDPLEDTSTSTSEALSYGIWQLTFVNGHLTTRSKVIVQKDGRSNIVGRNLTKTILGLPLGTDIATAKAKLGTPEVVYVIYEDRSSPTKVLRYGSWELTFIDDALTQRAR
jgi:hypothetical protein